MPVVLITFNFRYSSLSQFCECIKYWISIRGAAGDVQINWNNFLYGTYPGWHSQFRIGRDKTLTIGTFRFYICTCLLYTSDAADEEDSVDLGGRRIIKKKKK